ncbi:hypothetical protein CRG98_027181 [Punica granatum]|uniref:Uncharacterized protein n=1 Tax=Punica granatum TaxID=22663 RepID=A0A2I0J878_PUNGR|nr:hypothetical protein CRG98_027181 [Punica granatum]
MDENICRWILEFLLRQPVDDAVVKLALSSLPLPPDCSLPLGFKKSIVLRTVESALADASISETLLEHLETLEAIDTELGDPVPGSLKDAYLAVALECTLRCLHGGAEGETMYSDAVQRFWRGRVQAMEAKSQLITAELLQWSAQLEAALSDDSEPEKLMRVETRADALRLVRAYLDEAYVKLGPSFLERAALSTAIGREASAPSPNSESAAATAADAAIAPGVNREAPEVRDFAKDVSGPNAGTTCNGHQSSESAPSSSAATDTADAANGASATAPGVNREAPEVRDSAKDATGPKTDDDPAGAGAATTPGERENREAPEVRDSAKDASGPNADTPCSAHQSVAAKRKNERLRRVVPSRTKQEPLHRRRGGIKITDTGEMGGQTSGSSYDSLPTALVDKVHEALKSSSLELQRAVKDPLPEAMRVAASLVADGADRATNPESMPPDQIGKDVSATDPSLDKSATDAAPSKSGNCEAQHCGPLIVLPRRSLMERNRSAQTYEVSSHGQISA